MATINQDEAYMKVALGLAQRGLGLVAPNPAVGCVIVNGGVVVGRGFTQKGGRPHAETEALKQAGERARGATAYVTLEPCSHTGVTGPCAQALIDAGIARVVAAIGDSDERVAGRGFAMLRQAGVEVEVGVCEREATLINRGFLNRVSLGRPAFTLKVASSIDGKIALENGDSQWITGSVARAYGHLLRARHDAILVGIGTVLADDPMLDCRLPGLEDRSPQRVILDSKLRIPMDSRLVATARQMPTLVLSETSDGDKISALRSAGVVVEVLSTLSDLSLVSNMLANQGITRVLVEGGGRVHASFLRAGITDRLLHFIGPKLLGGESIPMVGDLGLASLDEAPHLTCTSLRRLGTDILASYEKPE